MTSSAPASSVLLIGATGRLGLHILRQLANHAPRPQVHAFCRDPFKLSDKDRSLCTSVIQGNARRQGSIEMALRTTQADIVIVSIGNGDSTAKSAVRSISAEALSNAMMKPQFAHVRTYVVSSIGAGSSRIKVGFGLGKLIELQLRHVLKDHTEQEEAFEHIRDRTVIVRPTSLVENKSTGKVKQFGDREKCPNVKTERADVAKWIVDDMYLTGAGGKVVNIASKK